jgi:hypothetical protein
MKSYDVFEHSDNEVDVSPESPSHWFPTPFSRMIHDDLLSRRCSLVVPSKDCRVDSAIMEMVQAEGPYPRGEKWRESLNDG